MNGSYRKRKSMWDMKEDSFPPSEISENNAWKSKDNRSRLSDLEADDELQRKDSRWPSSEPSQGHNSNSRRGNNIGKDRHEFPENPRSWGGDDRYRRSISPGYDGRGQQNRSRSPENTWNQSYRGRDRMGNRSRARDGSLSRSGSQSRSRSRSWSRSPLRGGGGDRRRESYGMSDRRCGSGQPCRELAMGKCRRGSQCRFLHQDRQVDNDLSERGALKYGNSKGPRDNSYDRGNRNPNPSFDHEQRRPHTKILCKFFQIGKCQRQDCRFSHEGPTSGNREERPRWGRESEDTKKSWNGPSWDDVAGGSNFAKLSGWGGDNSVSNMNSSDPRTDEKQSNDDKWGHTLGGSPAWQDKSALEDRYHDNSQGNREINNVGSNEFSGMRREDSSHHQPQTDVPENSYMNENRGHKMDEYMVADGSSELNTAHSLPLTGQSFSRSINSTGTVSPSKSFGVTDQNRQFLYRSPSNGHNIIDSKGSLQEGFSPLSPQNPTQSQIYHQEEAKMQTPVEYEVPLATNEAQQSILTSEQLAQIATLPASLSQRFGNGQLLSQLYAVSEPDPVPVPPVVVMDDPVARSQVQYNTTGNDGGEPLLQSSGGGLDNESGKINQTGDPANENQEPNQNQEVKENNNVGAEKTKEDRENMVSGNGDEKGMRLFKGALVEFVKDILKPTWKEGKMSREVHKTIVKKVVDKVTGSVQGVNIPKTQEKIDQYLSFSKPKITKLVQAYVERLLKN